MVDDGDGGGRHALERFVVDVYAAATQAALRESPVWPVPPRPDSLSPESAVTIVGIARLVGARFAAMVPPDRKQEMARRAPEIAADLRTLR